MSKPRAPLRVGLLITGLIVGLGVSLFVGFFFSMVLQYALTQKADEEGRQGWVLVPVLVAGGDVAAGGLLDVQALARRDLPAQLVTSLVLRPDSASSVLGHASTVPIKTGDLLRSTFLAREPHEPTPAEEPLAKACQRALESRSADVRQERTLEEIRERMLRGGAR